VIDCGGKSCYDGVMNNIVVCPHALSHDCPFAPEDPVFGFDGCRFYHRGRTADIPPGHQLAILHTLWRAGCKKIPESALYAAMYGSHEDVADPHNNLMVNLCMLRKRLRPIGLSILSIPRSSCYGERHYALRIDPKN